MSKNSGLPMLLLILSIALYLTGCRQSDPAIPADEATPTPTEVATAAATIENLPRITAVNLDHASTPRYASIEMIVSLEAAYENPFDAREVKLEGHFTGPDGTDMLIPGFWDTEEAWRIRFTPSQEGEWHYQLTVSDDRGRSQPAAGTVTVTPSDQHGWLQVGEWVNPDYSGHYLVYHDGTPFYGLGHGDALNILIDGFDIDNGVHLFDNMREANENFVVWWPFYTSSPIGSTYDNYATSSVKLIDLTEMMWQRIERPNWVGEFGVGGNTYYPELYHNAIWAALGAGAAMTPAEWNGAGFWGRMTPEMLADLNRLRQFVADIPLAHLDPAALQISSSDPVVRGWGVAGEAGGLFWVQDFSLEGQPISAVRQAEIAHEDVQVTVQGLAQGTYTIHPYDTWQGTYLDTFEVACTANQVCVIDLPPFGADMAFRIASK